MEENLVLKDTPYRQADYKMTLTGFTTLSRAQQQDSSKDYTLILLMHTPPVTSCFASRYRWTTRSLKVQFY